MAWTIIHIQNDLSYAAHIEFWDDKEDSLVTFDIDPGASIKFGLYVFYLFLQVVLLMILNRYL